jgi:hypothetical protein
MSKEEIYNLAEQANDICEGQNKPFRFWIVADRFFICNNIDEMEDIDELTEKHFVNRMKRIINSAR